MKHLYRHRKLSGVTVESLAAKFGVTEDEVIDILAGKLFAGVGDE